MLSFLDFIKESININMTHRDVSSHLKKTGWKLDRQRGDHDVWSHEKSVNKIAVPRHKGNLAPGTVRDIMKKSQTIH